MVCTVVNYTKLSLAWRHTTRTASCQHQEIFFSHQEENTKCHDDDRRFLHHRDLVGCLKCPPCSRGRNDKSSSGSGEFFVCFSPSPPFPDGRPFHLASCRDRQWSHPTHPPSVGASTVSTTRDTKKGLKRDKSSFVFYPCCCRCCGRRKISEEDFDYILAFYDDPFILFTRSNTNHLKTKLLSAFFLLFCLVILGMP